MLSVGALPSGEATFLLAAPKTVSRPRGDILPLRKSALSSRGGLLRSWKSALPSRGGLLRWSKNALSSRGGLLRWRKNALSPRGGLLRWSKNALPSWKSILSPSKKAATRQERVGATTNGGHRQLPNDSLEPDALDASREHEAGSVKTASEGTRPFRARRSRSVHARSCNRSCGSHNATSGGIDKDHRRDRRRATIRLWTARRSDLSTRSTLSSGSGRLAMISFTICDGLRKRILSPFCRSA
jgi:hypothetical protein